MGYKVEVREWVRSEDDIEAIRDMIRENPDKYEGYTVSIIFGYDTTYLLMRYMDDRYYFMRSWYEVDDDE